uniref:Uncharacterized protein n=1 Tax=viral metagenome TaxID=1070528 RepID=A0A6M3L8R5_9ZZZZ
MKLKHILAWALCTPLYRLQFATGGRCGGFGLYGALWRVYTDNYNVSRSGRVRRDWKDAQRQQH